MFSNKKLIAQYEARISDLQKQIEDLRSLVMPPRKQGIPMVQLEVDAVLGSREETIELTPEQSEEYAEINSEASRILSGMY